MSYTYSYVLATTWHQTYTVVVARALHLLQSTTSKYLVSQTTDFTVSILKARLKCRLLLNQFLVHVTQFL